MPTISTTPSSSLDQRVRSDARGRHGRPSRIRALRAPFVIVLATGMFATLALPAYVNGDGASASAATDHVAEQSLSVSDATKLTGLASSSYTAKAAAAAVYRTTTAAQVSAYDGETVDDYLKHPIYSKVSGTALLKVASQYIGDPYVFGGDTPAGFDCSGFVMFVYAQFGISMVHSVPNEAAMGTVIPHSEAQVGDLIVFPNYHIGFYAGDGKILDAGNPSVGVSERPIWTDAYEVVRI